MLLIILILFISFILFVPKYDVIVPLTNNGVYILQNRITGKTHFLHYQPERLEYFWFPITKSTPVRK
jgi:hypothetical protein